MWYRLIKLADIPSLSADGGQTQQSASQGEWGKLQRVFVAKRGVRISHEVKDEPVE